MRCQKKNNQFKKTVGRNGYAGGRRPPLRDAFPVKIGFNLT